MKYWLIVIPSFAALLFILGHFGESGFISPKVGASIVVSFFFAVLTGFGEYQKAQKKKIKSESKDAPTTEPKVGTNSILPVNQVVNKWAPNPERTSDANEIQGISDDQGFELADSSITKIEIQTDLMGGKCEKSTTEVSQDFTHTESPKISSHKIMWIIGGLLIIFLSFGVHGFVEDESPNLSWSFISCGIWASLAYLAPDKWFHIACLQVNWKKVRSWAGYALLITAFIAGLVLLMKASAFERSAEQSAEVKAADWEIVTIEDDDYVTADSILRFYHFESSNIKDSNIFLRSKNLILIAKIDSQEILINNIKFRLQKKIVQIDDDVLFSRLDLVQRIDPVLRPTMIKFSGAFDTVIIDAGHGGNDKGKVGIFGCEKDLTLELALALERELMQRGFGVIMTRRDDSSLLESERVDIANNATTSRCILLSLHFGSGGSEETGIQTLSLVSHPSDTGSSLDAASFALAAAVHGMIISRFKFVDLGIGSSSSMQFHGCKWPGIIFEGGFLSNEEECKVLASDTYRNSVSSAITDAVLNYQKAMADTRK